MIDFISDAPFERYSHKPTCDPLAPVLGPDEYVEDVPAPRTGADHMRRPIHQPEAYAGGDCVFVSKSEPSQILARFHFAF